jgi:glycosyltransferase involved in cell wall biosynthesis
MRQAEIIASSGPLFSTATDKLAILHFALNPITGVWSVMRELACAQTRAGIYPQVGIGIIADKSWPELYKRELQSSGLPHYLTYTPKMFGTVQDLWQRIKRPPLSEWIEDLLKRAGADSCCVHFHNAWISGVFMPLPKPRKGSVRMVATFHGVNAHFKRQPLRQALHRWMAHRLVKFGAILTSVDRGNLNRAETLLGMSPEGFKVVPNGITDTPVRGCPGLNGSKAFTVGHVGSINAAKGWQILVDAARQLRNRGLPIQVVLAGWGAEAEQARQLAKENSDWVSFRGFVARPREAVMKDLDALVLMSEQEGLPMAIVEAFSVAVPVVATAVGGVPEAVTDGRNGFLVPRSAEALARVLERLILNPGLHAAVAAQARREFEGTFEISKIVAQYHSVYVTEK